MRLVQPHLPHQQAADLIGHPGVDLEADGRGTPLPALQDGLDGGEQVVGLVLLHLHVGVARDAEHVVGDEVHPGEQLLQVRRDGLLQRHEPLTVEAAR